MTEEHCSYPFPAEEGLSARLDLSPIEDLLEAGAAGFRVYEVFRHQGLQHYVDLVLESDEPGRFAWWPMALHSREGRSCLSESALHPRVPIAIPPAILAAALRGAAAYDERVQALRAQLRASTDELIAYELDLIDAGQHPNDLLLAKADPARPLERHFRGRYRRRYSAALYALVSELLAHPGTRGFSLRGTADSFVLQLACREQFRRSGAALSAGIFPIAALGRSAGPSYEPDDGYLIALDPMPAWMGGGRWHSEGLAMHGLFFDEGRFGGVDYAVIDAAQGPDIDAILARRRVARARSTRLWFAAPDGMFLGLGRDSLAQWEALLARHIQSGPLGY